MDPRTKKVAQRAAQVYFDYRAAIAEMLTGVPNPEEARSIAHAIAVQIAAHEALHAAE